MEKPHNLKSVEDKDDGDDGCGDSHGEESTEKASKRQNRTSYQDEPIIATAKFIDLVQVGHVSYFQTVLVSKF